MNYSDTNNSTHKNKNRFNTSRSFCNIKKE